MGILGRKEPVRRVFATWLVDFLTKIGATAELRATIPGRPNVVARWPTDRPGKPRILFAPHTDTVSVAGMEIDPFGGQIHEGRVWGRGASDTKGPMAAMLWALRSMREKLGSLPYEIWFAGLAGEEAGQHGAKALAAEEEFAFVIAGEPTGLDVSTPIKDARSFASSRTGRPRTALVRSWVRTPSTRWQTSARYIRDVLAREISQPKISSLGAPRSALVRSMEGSKTNIVPGSVRSGRRYPDDSRSEFA
jgi:acetylornithine deacetylase/succinyl-diaminopimelate desuccinylase-like protein